KRNYEKIILSIVLLGLVGVAGFLPVLIGSDQDTMKNFVYMLTNPRVVQLPDLDTSNQDAVISRIKSTNTLDLSTTNRLFNPVIWQKNKEGGLIKVVSGNEVGGGAVVVSKITPLYFEVTLLAVITNEATPTYQISVENQASDVPAKRRAQSHYISLEEKTGGLQLKNVKGPATNPTELDIHLTDSGQNITVAPGTSYRRVDGYVVDLKYPPENLTFNGQRVGAQLNFAGDQYNIIAIDENDVILLAQSNQKKFVRPYAP
ncbi:MAG TPA: hypothetical protein VGN23_16640, partial [Verrucomicrobiae bacterium]